jgi:hypothetical protein
MDPLRAAFLLESEMGQLECVSTWKRRNLENIVRVAIRALREAAERIEELEALQSQPLVPPVTGMGGDDGVVTPAAGPLRTDTRRSLPAPRAIANQMNGATPGSRS